MTEHISEDVVGTGAHFRRYRNAGRNAARKACDGMLVRCGPGGDMDVAGWVQAVTRAAGEAQQQMLASGATEYQVSVWAEGFTVGCKEYEDRFTAMSARLSNAVLAGPRCLQSRQP